MGVGSLAMNIDCMAMGVFSDQKKNKQSKDPVIELKPPVTVARKSEKKPQITPNKSLGRFDVWMVFASRVF